MRVTKTIKDYIEKQLIERREAILAPYREEANDSWEKFSEEAKAIVESGEEEIKRKLDALAAAYHIVSPDGEHVVAKSLEIRSYAFYNQCENWLPAKALYYKKKNEVGAKFTKEKEELLVSLELGDMDKKSLLAAIADIKLEG